MLYCEFSVRKVIKKEGHRHPLCLHQVPTLSFSSLAAGLDCQPLDLPELGIFPASHLSSAYRSGFCFFVVVKCVFKFRLNIYLFHSLSL